MGKLSFLLAEDYIKPKIYFRSTTSIDSIIYSKDNKKQFHGLDYLSQMLLSSTGFIVNAFQIDYYQLLPRLIFESIDAHQIQKKLYLVGPELSLSIIKRSFNTSYDRNFYNFQYLNIENNPDDLLNQCVDLLKEGHIVYLLPEATFHWEPSFLKENKYSTIPSCSSLLSQLANTPVLTTTILDESNKITILHPDLPSEYSGSLNECIEKQSQTIYQSLTT